MAQLTLILIPFLLLAFWAWMFSDMMNSDYLPPCFITFTNGNDTKFDWKVAFVFLNVFAAIYYYVNEYRNRHSLSLPILNKRAT